MGIDLELLRSLPKVSLHDHLDGGLRPATIIELAAGIGYPLPAQTASELARWFVDSATSGSLERYLSTFEYTVAVMQTPDQLRRVAAEFVEDLVADGVVYGEVRWAPDLHTRAGLSPAQAVSAVRDGLEQGMADCRARGAWIEVRQLLTSLRQTVPTTHIAELVLAYRDQGVVGYDLAGPERGFAPERFLPALELLRRANATYTIHAGEGDGPASIWAAVQLCHANRIGHGVRIVEDIDFSGPEPRLGRLAGYVRDWRIPLEVAPTSNVQTGAASSIAAHPFGVLDRLGFTLTVNPDNRLMSATTVTGEFAVLADAFGYGVDDVLRLTRNAVDVSFQPADRRLWLLEKVILPAYAAAGNRS